MSWLSRSFLSVSDFSKSDIVSIFELASNFEKNGIPESESNVVVAPLFFEPSTRTSMSFQVAAARLGYHFLNFDVESSSMKKGETLLHTLQTVDVMGPQILIVRHGFANESLKSISEHLDTPIINAGEGVSGHPTQALLDTYTILNERGQLEGEKVLFLGDVKHSRVFFSNREILTMFGAEVGVCSENSIGGADVTYFESIEEGLEWATVCMALRTQNERHIKEASALAEWLRRNQLTKEKLSSFHSEGIVMHPGPFRIGEEITGDILEDPRCRIFHQKRNGVLIRAALMRMIVEGEE